jgi:hypothetical protein
VALRRFAVRFAPGDMGSDAANTSTDADLYALSNQHRNAVHQMRRADEAGDDRAARSKLRCTDLPVYALRFRRELFKGALDRFLPVHDRSSLLRQHKPLLPHLDQAEFGQNAQILVADGRHFQATGLNVPQPPAKTDGSSEIQISEGIVQHPLRLLGHFDQILSAPRRLLVRTR